MTSSGGASFGGLREGPRALEREETSNARDGEASAALWAALAQRVSASHTLALPADETPSAWRASAGVLTPAAASSGVEDGAPSDPRAPERLVVRVDGGELGELEVTVDREHGALRIVIGLDNEGLARSVAPDGHSLRKALEGAGMTVRSLNIVAASEVGTVLARHRASPTAPKPETVKGGDERDPEATQKRAHKRLTLIG